MENTLESAKAFLKQNEVYSEYHVVCDKLPEESKQVSGLLVAYAKSVRPEVVVPSEERMNDLAQAFDELPKTKESKDTWECAAFKKGSRMTLSELRRLNPTLTFTELNHTAPTGYKPDEG